MCAPPEPSGDESCVLAPGRLTGPLLLNSTDTGQSGLAQVSFPHSSALRAASDPSVRLTTHKHRHSPA